MAAGILLCFCASLNAGEIRLQAQSGFSWQHRDGHWFPVAIDVDYAPADASSVLACELRLHAWSESPNIRPLLYKRPLRMGPGRKQLSLYWIANDTILPGRFRPLRVSLWDPARAEERYSTVLAPPSESFFYGATYGQHTFTILSLNHREEPQDPLGLSPLLMRTPQEAYLRDRPMGTAQRPATVLHQPAASVPDRWFGYEGVDALIWHHPRPDRLRPEQFAAIRNWVYQGGHLYLTWQNGTPITNSTPLADWLPATVTACEPLKWDPPQRKPARLYLAGSGRHEYWSSGRARLKAGHIATWKVEAERAVPLLGHPLFLSRPNDIPLARRCTYGLGSVTFVCWDLSQSALGAFPGRRALWGRILQCVFEAGERYRFLPKDDRQARIMALGMRRGTGLSSVAQRYLARTPQLEPVPFAYIVLFLVGYVLLIGPGDHLVLSRLHLLHRTWYTSLALILVFSALAWGMASHFRGEQTFARAVVVEDSQVGSPLVSRTCYYGLYSTESTRIDMRFGTGASWTRCRGEASLQKAPSPDTEETPPPDGYARALHQGHENLWERVPLHQWSMKTFLSRSVLPGATAVLSGDLHYRERTITGSLTTRIRLSRCLLVGRHGVFDLKDLAKGETWSPGNQRGRPLLPCLAKWAQIPFSQSIYRAPQQRLPDGTASNIDWFVAASLPRLLSWPLRPLIAREQYAGLLSAQKDELPPRPGDPSPALGLSIPQIWNAEVLVDNREASDLSWFVYTGGLVLFAEAPYEPCGVTPAMREVEETGKRYIRVLFPPHEDTERGRLWNDDLYGKPYTPVRTK